MKKVRYDVKDIVNLEDIEKYNQTGIPSKNMTLDFADNSCRKNNASNEAFVADTDDSDLSTDH